MGEITNIFANKPHIQGPAKCLECGHKWHVVAPEGDATFECPECGTYKGVLIGVISPDENTEIWVCNCGCDFFNVLNDGFMCVRCGKKQCFD